MHETKTPTPEEAERQFRELIADGDLPQPDRVVQRSGASRDVVAGAERGHLVERDPANA